MKIALFVITLLSLTAFSKAGTFLEAKRRFYGGTESLSPENLISNLKKTDFGKSILNLLSLQFKTSGKLDDVTNLINNLQTSLRNQQEDEDSRYAQTTDNNNKIIADQSKIVDDANVNIENYQKQLSDANAQNAQLTQNQQLLQQESDGIQAQLQKLAQIREKEAGDFAERTKNSQVLLTGIQNTITLFKQAVTNGKFDQKSVDQIEALLQSLQAAFTASMAQDQQQEDQAVQNYNDFVSEKNIRLADIKDQLQAISLELTRLQALISQLTDAITAQTTSRDNAQALKDRTVQAQKDLDSKYNNNKAVRADQLKLLANAVHTLNANSADVQNYLNQS